MPEYQKLVRGKIPGIIEAAGEVPVIRTLENDAEFLYKLVDKVGEEGAERIAAETPEEEIEEEADILETALAIVKLLSLKPGVEEARAKKAEERGDFGERIFLERTE